MKENTIGTIVEDLTAFLDLDLNLTNAYREEYILKMDYSIYIVYYDILHFI